MLRFKMLARDVNSNPTQYRTWIVANNPDLNAQFYYGYKSGNNVLADISAYAINDPSVIANFNLPLPTNWNPGPSELIQDFPIRKVLPATCEDSQLVIIDGYIYMFGGNFTDHIYQASLNNPADWIDTGATLPTILYGAALAIVDGYIYLFGGNSGEVDELGFGAVNTIFSAPVTNPLNWTNTGATLPLSIQHSHLGMYGGYLYLFGGHEVGGPTSTILRASTSNPTVWASIGNIPVPLFGSSLAQIDGYWMLFGGNLSPSTLSSAIWIAPITNPTSWSLDGYLPYQTSFSQFLTIGNDGYIIGPMVGQTPFSGFTPIIQCHLSKPNKWFDTNQYVRGQISHSNLAIVYDRIWLFGGSGETAVFACNQQLKYNYYNATVQDYGNITRVLFPTTNNLLAPYQVLCFPYWKTDYSMNQPPIPPPVPPPPLPQYPPFPPTTPVPPYI